MAQLTIPITVDWEGIKDRIGNDFVEVVRCKDCKHRPKGTDRHDLEFPDYVCPCQCEDYWYSWMPKDDWFCADGEREAAE